MLSRIFTLFLNLGFVYSQKLNMRTKAGKNAVKRQKQVDAVVGGVKMIEKLSEKENRVKAKASLKKNAKSVKENTKQEFNKLKDAWKNRKKK